MDWEIIVLTLFLLGTVAGFMWRRTRVKAYYYIWLILMWLEVQARKAYTKNNPDDPKPKI